MRPYLAVVVDSFREAFASRVLPVLLVLFTLALLAIAPLGLRVETPAEGTPPGEEMVRLAYLGMDPFSWLLGDAAFPRGQVETILQGVLATFCNYFLGKFGVSIAILVTANVIPRMFEPGSIDLLLSKPVSRSLLFLAKFFSGCAFILVSVSYFLLGLWLILGVRFGLWSGQLLLAIPVFVFVFSIVYSLSAVAGVVWRNPVVSVMIALSAWAFCMVLGNLRSALDLERNGGRAAVIVAAGDGPIVSDKSGGTFAWRADADGGRWVEIFEGPKASRLQLGLFRPLIGPVGDQAGRLWAMESVPSATDLRATPGAIVVSDPARGHARHRVAQAPADAVGLFVSANEVLAVGPSGAHVATIGAKPESSRLEFIKRAPAGTATWSTPFAAAWNDAAGELAVSDRGTVRLYKRTENGDFAPGPHRDLGSTQPVLIASSGGVVLVARADGTLAPLDRDTLHTRREFRPFGDVAPRSVAASPDGRWFAVLFHHRRLWLFDASRNRVLTPSLRSQGDVSAVAFDDQNRLLVADRARRLTRHETEEFAVDAEFDPPATTTERLFDYVVEPLYAVCPKPGDLDHLVNYLFTARGAEATPGNEENLQAERNAPEIWRPVWSNLLFLAVVLGLTCLSIERKDF